MATCKTPIESSPICMDGEQGKGREREALARRMHRAQAGPYPLAGAWAAPQPSLPAAPVATSPAGTTPFWRVLRSGETGTALPT